MKYQLAELIDLDTCKTILENFCEAVNIGSAIIDLDGNVLIGIRWQRICTEFHRVNEEACQLCIESDTQLANELKDGKKYTIYQCKNGMTDAASPIIVEGEHIANVFIGQFLLQDPDKEYFQKQAAKYGFDEKNYLSALEDVPIVPEEKIPFILNFMASFAQTVASMGLENLGRKKVEAALRESESRYKALIAASNTGAWEYNTKTGFLWCSDEYFSMLGRSAEDFDLSGANNIEETWVNLLHPEDRDAASTGFADYLAGGSKGVYEKFFRMLHADGHWVWIWSRGSTLRDEAGNVTVKTVGTHIDITEQKNAELELEQHRNNLETLVEQRTAELAKSTQELLLRTRAIEQSPATVVITNTQGNIIYVNPKFVQLTGYTVEEALGNNPKVLKSGVHPPELYEEMWDKISKGENWEGELCNRKKNGDLYWEYAFIAPVRNDQGEITHYVAVKEDISDRKEVEQRLRASETQFRDLMDSAPDGMVIVDEEGEIKIVNAQAEKLFGYTRDEMIGQKIELLVPERFREGHPTKRNAFIQDRSIRGTTTLELVARRKDGSEFPADISVSPVDTPQGHMVSASVRDISERKVREQMIRLNSVIGDVLIAEKNLRNQLQGCCQAFVDIIDAAFVRIWTTDESNEYLLLQASAGLYTHIDGSRARVKIGQKKIGKIALRGATRIDGNLQDDAVIDDVEWAKENSLTSFYGYPMTVEDQVIGVVGLFFKKELQPEVAEALPSMANTIAIAIERERAEKELENKMDELERFNKFAVGRELKMINLKEEINELFEKSGQAIKYKIVKDDDPYKME